MYGAMALAEAVCINVGFGAYPKELELKCGHGPLRKVTEETLKNPEKLEYDFETIKSFDPFTVETCTSFREATRHWNKCIQYWMAIYVYKQFPSKKFRMTATMTVSSFWHGIHGGDFLMMMGPTFYVPLENLFMKELMSLQVNGWHQTLINAVLCALKTFAFSYMGICFWLQDFDKIWIYYSSVYHFGYILWLALYVTCIVFKIMKSKQNFKHDHQ